MSESEIATKELAPVNALTHGLTAKTVLVPGEDPTVWESFQGLVVAELAPAGPLEEFLAHRVAAAAWRLLRVERLEGALSSIRLDEVPELLRSAREGRGPGRWRMPPAGVYDGLAKLARHEAAIERAFFRSLSALKKLQGLRLRGSGLG
jgi:hypothetical protein